MRKNRRLFQEIVVSFIAFILVACSINRGIIYEVQNHGIILLSEVSLYNNAKPPFNHPYKLNEKTISSMMSSLKCDDKRVFSDKEIDEFAEKIRKAFLKADSKSFISFYISEKAIRYISGGEVFIKGNKCYWYFYPSSEIYLRTAVIEERLECLSNRRFEINISLPGT